MSAHIFRIVEHIVPCQHIREYPRATAVKQEDVLHLAVKQYIPLENPEYRPGAVTIIGAHANGFPKELYEPLWDEILHRSKEQNFRIRSIWIADVACQGSSGVLNERLLGNDPGWHDHARDLLHLINLKRDQMSRPIMGIGHSFGASTLTYLSLLHPRLLSTLVLLDPVIAAPSPGHRNSGYSVARMSTCRRDLWPSREDAINSFKKSKFYASWDPRVLEKWFQYGLRRLPTLIYPDANEGDERVTLTTTKHQEVFTFVRPNFQGFRTGEFDQKNHPDMEPEAATGSAFVRAEGLEVFRRLPNVRPSVLYVFGSESDLSTPEMRKAKIDATGVGVGGSGGAKAGRVKEVVLKGVGHLVAMEAVEQCADAATEWIGTEYKRWNAEEEEFRSMWSKNSMLEKTTFDNEFRETMGSLSKSATTPAKAKL